MTDAKFGPEANDSYHLSSEKICSFLVLAIEIEILGLDALAQY